MVNGQALHLNISNDDLSDPVKQVERQFTSQPSAEIETAIVKEIFR